MGPHCLAALAGLLAVAVPGVAERADFDCPMRDLALEYAAYIQPFRPAEAFQQLTDALNGSPEKVPNCTVTSLESNRFQSNTRFQYSPLPAGGNTFYADPIYGNDRNPGTESQPFKTIDAALNATRQTDAGKNTIVLRNGTFYQASTVTLGIQDSGLTIQAYPNETVWISGAAPLTQVTWTPRNVSTGPVWTVAQSTNYVFGDVPSPYVLFNGTYDSWGGCQAACEANFSAGGPCTIWTWHDTTVEPEYQLHCYFRIDGRLVPTVDPGHVSGNLGPGMNVWQASLAGTSFTSVLGLRWNARRMIRARFPNSDPETDGFGAFFYANSWTAQTTPRAPDVQIDLPTPVRNTSKSMFQTFTAGVGGTCDRFQPAAGYWCSNAVQGGGSVIYYAPSAMQVNQSILPHTPYANPIGAVVQTWRPGFWCSWMMEVSSATFNPIDGSTNFSLPWGAFQGSRGADAGEGTYVENVMEELDAPAEWFFNTTTQMLYLWHNASAGTPPPLDGSIVLTQIKHLFNVTGTQDAPVTDITFSGLGFRDTSYTYLDPHGIPSGGDWALERSAVLFFEGTERVNVSGSVFERVDGNAIVLSAYNRNATIAYNEFYYIGSTAIAQWGNTDGGDPRLPAGYGQDGTSGDQPRGTRIMYNLCHELGIWEKQSSFYTQFKSGRNHLEGNIVYNGPRAHINFNDGFLGGSLVTRNLVFNSCRESSDHGPVRCVSVGALN